MVKTIKDKKTGEKLILEPNADLRDVKLSNADLSNTDLRGADFRDADLSNTDLRDAWLSGVKLSGAKLYNCVGDGDIVLTLQLPPYRIVLTKTHMFAGCKGHTIEQWKELQKSNESLKQLDSQAVEFANKYADIIWQVHSNHFENIN